MKRYKVVQDAHGHWGIWDTERWHEFASWGWDSAWLWRELTLWAERLNAGTAEKDEFVWVHYDPRKDNR